MNRYYLLPAIGALLALNGLAFAFTDYAWIAPWVGLAGVMAADSGFSRAATLPKFWAAVAAYLAFAAACALTLHPWLGLGLGLALTGHVLRTPFLKSWGATGFFWAEPLACWSGLALAFLGALKAPGWQAWPFFAFGLVQGIMVLLGLLQSLAILKAKSGGYAAAPGRPAPDFSLPDDDGKLQSLSGLRGKNLVLIFVRGDWCPSCHITLRTYARNRERFQEKDVMLLAIGPDPVGVNKRMVTELGIPFKMLSDEGQLVASAYGVQMSDPISKKLKPEGVPLPASFLVDSGGTVRYTSRPERAGEFLNPDTIFPVLQGLAA